MNLVLNTLIRSAKWGAEGTFVEVCKGLWHVTDVEAGSIGCRFGSTCQCLLWWASWGEHGTVHTDSDNCTCTNVPCTPVPGMSKSVFGFLTGVGAKACSRVSKSAGVPARWISHFDRFGSTDAAAQAVSVHVLLFLPFLRLAFGIWFVLILICATSLTLSFFAPVKPKEWPAHVIDLLTSFIVCTSEVKGVSKWMHFFISVFLQPLWHFIKALAKQSMNLCKTGVLGPVCLKLSKNSCRFRRFAGWSCYGMGWAGLQKLPARTIHHGGWMKHIK